MCVKHLTIVLRAVSLSSRLLMEIKIGMIKIMTLNNALCEYRIILNVLIVCLFL